MWGATSGTKDRVIDHDVLEDDMLMAQEPFISAEVDYRRARNTAQFPRRRPRRIRVPRRPNLTLPAPRRRPVPAA
jgi:hypothetical protein